MNYQLKVTLKHVKPAIWRRVVVPARISLDVLHETLQIIFGWEDCHLHVFNVPGRKYGVPDPDFPELEVNPEEAARLNDVLTKPKSKMIYEYDFGDGWEHEIVLEKILDADSSERSYNCLAGARACPPEDCGGPFGYNRLLKILSNPKHPEHEDITEWIGEDFDAEECDLPAINKELGAYRRGL